MTLQQAAKAAMESVGIRVGRRCCMGQLLSVVIRVSEVYGLGTKTGFIARTTDS